MFILFLIVQNIALHFPRVLQIMQPPNLRCRFLCIKFMYAQASLYFLSYLGTCKLHAVIPALHQILRSMQKEHIQNYANVVILVRHELSIDLMINPSSEYA